MNAGDARLTTHSCALAALRELCTGLVDADEAFAGCSAIEPWQMPDSFRRLLSHHEHMTTRLLEYHGRPVDVRVQAEDVAGDLYRRRIVLVLRGTDRIVEFGIVKIRLHYLDAEARGEVLTRDTPLGDVLIRHNVLRRIEPRWFLRFPASGPVADELTGAGESVFGRLGTIYCNEEPAIELLEVVTDQRGHD